MENKIRLEIVTPYGQIMGEDVDEIATSGSEGDFGVLPGHVNFITTLKIAMLTYRKGNEVKYVFINSGYAEVGPEKVTILSDSAEISEDIDAARATASMKRAEERLRQQDKIDVGRAT